VLFRSDRAKLTEAGFVLPDAPVSEIGEQFRLVKRQLLARDGGADAARRVLVCSANTGEGKTFCAVNLALSLAAEKDLQVLLIDADMVKPGVVSTLGIEDGPGLMDALADEALRIEDLVVRTDIPSLAVLPAGRHTNADTEYLASAHMARLLDRLTAGRPDLVVLFDSPPLLAASPAGVLAGLVDQALLVVRADVTSESALRDSVGMLRACDDIRLLLNAATAGTGTRFGSYYGKAA
jgi:exopolysaccharide/PEP-CTERM locus tyrosine autokinase